MADITLHTSNANQITCVSNAFIDTYMNDADGEYVKIYLYLLRSLGRKNCALSIEDMADKLDHTQKDILKALNYWSQKEVIRLEYDGSGDLAGICLTDLQGHDTAIAPVSHVAAPAGFVVNMNSDNSAKPAEPKKTPSVPNYTAAERSALSVNPDIQEIIFVAQQNLNKILSAKDTNTLLFWYDELGMSAELIEYLIESRVEQGHPSFAYMNTVALAWAEQGISTVAAAIEVSQSHFSPINLVIKAFGIKNRDLVEKELAFVNKWFDEYKLSEELIKEACQRTVISKNQVNFPYADKILMEWFTKGVTSIEQIKVLDAEHSSAQVKPKSSAKSSNINGYSQRSIDYDALQKKLVNK